MMRIFRLIAGTMLLLGLAACHRPADEHASTAVVPMELKIYNVPPSQTGHLVDALSKALGGQANVTSAAPGKLLVYAPHGAQTSINTAIGSLDQTSSSAPPAQLDLHFWIVDGIAGAGIDDPSLKPLAAALEPVRSSTGPLHFRLNEALAARTSSGGRDGQIVSGDGGYRRSLEFLVSGVNGDKLDLWLGYDAIGQDGLANFKGQMSLQSGHYVVLAQGPGACTPTAPGKAVPPCSEKPALRLLIVRADILSPQA